MFVIVLFYLRHYTYKPSYTQPQPGASVRSCSARSSEGVVRESIIEHLRRFEEAAIMNTHLFRFGWMACRASGLN
jgi:hypothetical protein